MGLTRNYKNFLSLFIANAAGDDTVFDITSIKTLKDYNASLRVMTQGTDICYYNSGSNSSSKFTVITQTPRLTPLEMTTSISSSTSSTSDTGEKVLLFGTGTAEESINDYAMTPNFNIALVGSFSYNTTILEDGAIKTTVSGVFKSSEDVIINELGILHYRSLKTVESRASGSYPSYPFLMWRKKLDTPINFVTDTPVTVSFDIVMPNVVADY